MTEVPKQYIQDRVFKNSMGQAQKTKFIQGTERVETKLQMMAKLRVKN